MQNKFFFGPVRSRRFDMSLGLDIVPFKTCTIDCVYCECGATTNLSTNKRSFYNVNEILDEIDKVLPTFNPSEINYITITGSGEPTLNANLKQIVEYIKKNFPNFKLAILTNGTMLWNKKVVEALQQLDVVKISIDAVTDMSFQKINRPCKNLDLQKIINGIISFCKTFKHKIWLETFIIDGINNTETELLGFADVFSQINAEVIHINSLDRVGVLNWVKPASYESLVQVKDFLESKKIGSTIEIIKKPNAQINEKQILNQIEMTEKIIDILKRRPSSMDDLLAIFEKDILEICIDKLLTDKKIELIDDGSSARTMYKLASN